MSLTANLGDAKTIVVHPTSMTHRRLTGGHHEAAGIPEGVVQIAVRLEDLEDLQSDCLRSFAAPGRCGQPAAAVFCLAVTLASHACPDYRRESGDLINNGCSNAFAVLGQLLEGHNLIKIHVAIDLICHGVNLAGVLRILRRGRQFPK